MGSIKMAKAKASEIDDAIKLAHLTDAVCNCRSYEYPEFPPESDDVLPESFDVESAKDLRKFYDRVSKLSNGLMRVAFGYGVLLDNVCDPAKDILELKPGLVTFDEDEKKALADFHAAVKQFLEVEKQPATEESYPEFKRVSNEKNIAAVRFAMLMLKSAGMEDAKQVATVETAGDAVTEATGTPWKRF